jgi:hypothetical protein
MSEPSVTPSPAAPSGPASGSAADRILAGIGDGFDLDAPDEGSEPTSAGKPKPAKPAKAPKPETPQPSDLEESDFADEPPTESTNTPRPPDPEPQPEAEPDEPEKPQFGPKDKGTKEKPLHVKDLPEDRFLKIRVNGEDEVVSLRDAVRGFIRKETFDRVYGQVNGNAEKALGLASRALEERQNTVQQLQQFLTNPRGMLDWCMKHAPQVADEFAKIYAVEYLQKWREKPEEKLRFEHERQMTAVREKEEAHARERADWERARALEENTAAKRKLLAPGYAEGMKLAGFPKVTEQFQTMSRAILNEIGKLRPLTPADVRDAIVTTARALQSPNVQDRKPPPVANTARDVVRTPAKPNGKGTDWNQVPYAQRMRDPNYFLQGRR